MTGSLARARPVLTNSHGRGSFKYFPNGSGPKVDHGWVFLAPRPIRKIFKTLCAATLLANLVFLAGNLSWLGKHDFPAWPQRQFSHAWEPRSCHPASS